GLILPQAVLDMPRYGCINVHASLLPRWRGAAPIQRAIEAGDRESGVTIMQMDAGLDTGAMLAKASCPIGDEDNAASLLDRLSDIGRQPLLDVLQAMASGQLEPETQDESQATYAHKIQKQEAQVDWREGATLIARKLRAFNPFPVAFSELQGQRIKFYRAEALPKSAGDYPPGSIAAADESGLVVECGEGSLRILELQMPGKRPMTIGELLLGNKALFAPGLRFG